MKYIDESHVHDETEARDLVAGCGIDLERQHVGTVVQRVTKTDNSKVRRIP